MKGDYVMETIIYRLKDCTEVELVLEDDVLTAMKISKLYVFEFGINLRSDESRTPVVDSLVNHVLDWVEAIMDEVTEMEHYRTIQIREKEVIKQ